MLPAPLHRVTPLRRDPAAGWLSSGGRWSVTITGLFAWFGWWVIVQAAGFATSYFLDQPYLNAASGVSYFDVTYGYMTPPRMVALTVAVLLLMPARYFALWLRAGKTASRAKADGAEAARPIDDLRDLDAEPDGTIVSLVGWVRGHGYLLHSAGGEKAVGLTLHCRGQHLIETLHNFDILDEAGSPALVVAAGARLMGQPNVQLSRADDEDRNLVHSLNLPAGVVPTYWNAYVVHDGDPVMVIGVKTTINDMTQLEQGKPAARTAVASDQSLPLLVIPLAAERRDV